MAKDKPTSMAGSMIPVENAGRLLCSNSGWSELTLPVEESTKGGVDAAPRYRAAKLNPADVFDSPDAVARDQRLNNLQKMEILQTWASKAVDRQHYMAEKAGKEEIILLADIVNALKALVKEEQSSCPRQV